MKEHTGHGADGFEDLADSLEQWAEAVLLEKHGPTDEQLRQLTIELSVGEELAQSIERHFHGEYADRFRSRMREVFKRLSEVTANAAHNREVEAAQTRGEPTIIETSRGPARMHAGAVVAAVDVFANPVCPVQWFAEKSPGKRVYSANIAMAVSTAVRASKELRGIHADLKAKQPATADDEGGADVDGVPQYVTLDQIGALVSKSKRTLRRYLDAQGGRDPMPEPCVRRKKGDGRPNEWRYDRVRPWLERTFDRGLPSQLPSGRHL